jgi:hypothetical protein
MKLVPYITASDYHGHRPLEPNTKTEIGEGLELATTRYLYVVCIYGAICLQILFLKHHIFLFCHEMLKFFA